MPDRWICLQPLFAVRLLFLCQAKKGWQNQEVLDAALCSLKSGTSRGCPADRTRRLIFLAALPLRRHNRAGSKG